MSTRHLFVRMMDGTHYDLGSLDEFGGLASEVGEEGDLEITTVDPDGRRGLFAAGQWAAAFTMEPEAIAGLFGLPITATLVEGRDYVVGAEPPAEPEPEPEPARLANGTRVRARVRRSLTDSYEICQGTITGAVEPIRQSHESDKSDTVWGYYTVRLDGEDRTRPLYAYEVEEIPQVGDRVRVLPGARNVFGPKPARVGLVGFLQSDPDGDGDVMVSGVGYVRPEYLERVSA